MSDGACMVLSTAASREEAVGIARAVLGARLAACVQILPVTSLYWWEGEIRDAAEHAMLFKARDADYPELEAAIGAHHGYDIPEIVKLPVAGCSEAYLSWLLRETERP